MTKENNSHEKKIGINFTQVLTTIVITAILSIGGTFIALNVKVARLEEKIISMKPYQTNQVSYDNSSQKSDSSYREVAPAILPDIIRSKQSQKVKPSYNIHNCFTDFDLRNFINNKTHEQSVSELMNDNSFIELIISIKRMNPAERQKLLQTNANIAKPTWASTGSISSNGQTEAGHQAELMISQSIVEKIKELIILSEDELIKKFK